MICFFTIEFWRDLIVQFFGSLAGVGVAIWLYYLGNRHNKTAKRKEEIDTQNRKLQYLYAVTRKILSISIFHYFSFKKYSEELSLDPIKQHLIKSNPIYELHRFTSQLNVEDYYLAYVAQVKSDDASATFNEIISICEFIAFSIEDALRVNKEKLTNIYTNKLQFRENFNKVVSLLGDSEVQQQRWGDSEFENLLNASFSSYVGRADGVDDVAAGFSYFIKPLINELNKKPVYRILAMKPLSENLNSAARYYYAIRADGNNLKETFEIFSEGMNTACKKLITLLSDLHKHLGKIGFKERELPLWPLEDVPITSNGE